MGLSCVDGLTNSGFLAHIWALKEHKQRSGGRVVRRKLFGNVGGADAARNSRNNIRFARQQLEKMAKADSERWNFDFTAMRPKEGPLEWRAVDENTTPMSSSSSSASPCHPAASSRLQLPATSTCVTPASPSRNVLGTRGNDINNTITSASVTTMAQGSTFTTNTTSSIPSTSKTTLATTTTNNNTPANNDSSATTTSRVLTNSTTTKTATKAKTKRDSKHQLKRLIRNEPNTNNNRTRRGFRQTLCTDYFKTVRTARA